MCATRGSRMRPRRNQRCRAPLSRPSRFRRSNTRCSVHSMHDAHRASAWVRCARRHGIDTVGFECPVVMYGCLHVTTRASGAIRRVGGTQARCARLGGGRPAVPVGVPRQPGKGSRWFALARDQPTASGGGTADAGRTASGPLWHGASGDAWLSRVSESRERGCTRTVHRTDTAVRAVQLYGREMQ